MTETKKQIVVVMCDSLRDGVTFKHNYDNIQETIDTAVFDIIDTQKRIITVYDGDREKLDLTYMYFDHPEFGFNPKTATDKEIVDYLKQELEEYQAAYDEISDIDFINKLNDCETQYYYFVDFHKWHENQNRKNDDFVKEIIDEAE